MADNRHLEKSKNGLIWATAWPICAEYGNMIHIYHVKRSAV